MNKKKATTVLGLAGGAFLITFLLFQFGFFKKFEYLVYDQAAKWVRIPKAASDQVAIIMVDEASLQALNATVGRWPWPRALFADFLEFIMMGEPRAVLFDILFTETHFPRDAKGKLNPDDNALVAATAQSGRMTLSMQLIKDTEDEKNKGLMNRPLPRDFLDRYAMKGITGAMPGAGENNNYYIPITELYRVAHNVGVVEFAPDEDGVYRRTRPLREYGGYYFPVLGDAPFLEGKRVVTTGSSLVTEDHTVPLDAEGKYLINVYGKFNTYSISGIFASLQKIRAGEFENLMVDPAEFKDKIVYVGASAVGVEDLKPTAMAPLSPGVFLHASLASNFILNDFLVPPRPGVTVALLLLFSVIGSAGTFYVRFFALKLAIPAAAAAALAGGYYYSFSHNQLIDFIPPFAAIVLSSAGSFAYQVLTEGREKARVRQMFSQYVSPEVLTMMTESPTDLARLGAGTKEDISVLFSDIRGFTTFSDKTSPEQVVAMLNTHFNHMTDAIFRTRGTIDKFIGDAIMAYWGAPVRLPDHAMRAVAAAIDMTKLLTTVNAELAQKGIVMDLHIGIGINSGEAIVGNIGSEKKLNFTVIGDTVNLASRLESLNKNYGAPIIISEFTYRKLDSKMICRTLDRVHVRGKAEPVRIYEAMVYGGDAEKGAAEEQAALTNRAFEAYEKGDYKSALEMYNRVDNATLKELFTSRCKKELGEGNER
ncbi:MAG: adenylate/guanylate cyclase domain-containing protein [Nitrospinae bacterium]|nr:adenylate/guanylate cyclase domain-containing protein [Nitrospinota bacterium]